MNGKRSTNAFSQDYLSVLKDEEEPEGPWSRDEAGIPLLIREAGGRFGLYPPWRRPDLGDQPEAEFETLEDARLALAARLALRRSRFYELRDAAAPGSGGGYAVEREGRVVGHLRSYDPDWVYACHVLTCLAQSPEHLVTILDLAGPVAQEEIGEIMGRAALEKRKAGRVEEDDPSEGAPPA
ncbi:MAG TPA: hypothetical protein VE685_04080 [Thermoanaerobaculia bacterium]|nr:hypothetical protein [Thermoanaerobaculia bacterium]